MRPLRPLRLLIGSALVALPALPNPATGQWPAFEARVGYEWRGVATCGPVIRESGLAAGLEVRTRGTWIVSGGADMLFARYSCFDISYFTAYGDQVLEVLGSYSWVRTHVAVGRALDVRHVRSTLAVGVGLVPTHVTRRGPGTERSWEPWYGGAVTVRLPKSGVGVQLEVGRHRIPRHLYVEESDVLVAEIHRWERLVRLGLSFPLRG